MERHRGTLSACPHVEEASLWRCTPGVLEKGHTTGTEGPWWSSGDGREEEHRIFRAAKLLLGA